MNKRGQLGVIEMKFFIYGLIVGIILALLIVYLGSINAIPFQIPVCPVLPVK